MKKVLYILTNSSMPDRVKIGFTDNEDIPQRLKERYFRLNLMLETILKKDS